MFGKIICGVALVGSIVVACGPADSLNKNEGGACSKVDDCGGDLSCQPIQGRTGDFCCPAPPESSSHTNCHPGS
jgi:hypothetical protein